MVAAGEGTEEGGTAINGEARISSTTKGVTAAGEEEEAVATADITQKTTEEALAEYFGGTPHWQGPLNARCLVVFVTRGTLYEKSKCDIFSSTYYPASYSMAELSDLRIFHHDEYTP